MENNKLWDNLENIRFAIDCLEGSNSTPLKGGFFPNNKTIKERLKKILQLHSREEIDEILAFYNLSVDWSLIDSIMKGEI